MPDPVNKRGLIVSSNQNSDDNDLHDDEIDLSDPVEPPAHAPVPLDPSALTPLTAEAGSQPAETEPASAGPPKLRLPGGMGSRAKTGPAVGIPLDQLMAQRDEGKWSTQSEALPATNVPGPIQTQPPPPAPVPALAPLAPPQGAPARPVDARSPDEWLVLNRVNARLRDEVSELRRQQLKGPPVAQIALAGLAILVLGFIVGLYVGGQPSPAPNLVLVANYGRDRAAARYAGTGAAPPQDRADAQSLLKEAREHLEKRDIEGAIRLYKLCINLADLPLCHRDLGSVLALIGEPAARTHFKPLSRPEPSGAGRRQHSPGPQRSVTPVPSWDGSVVQTSLELTPKNCQP